MASGLSLPGTGLTITQAGEAAASIVVGSTAITGGTASGILWNNAGVLAAGAATLAGGTALAGLTSFSINGNLMTFPGIAASVGYLNIPQNSQSADYTTVAGDSGKQIYHPGADTTARTWTIDSNANVPYAIGTAITFINDTSAGIITIAITSDTLVLAGPGSTGSRTLAASGIATAVKMTSTRWIIGGTGLT